MQTYKEFVKQAEITLDTDFSNLSNSDIAMSAVPGLAAGAAVYGLSGFVPKLKDHKAIRLILAALGGAGTTLGFGMYFRNKNSEFEKEKHQRELLGWELQDMRNQHARDMDEITRLERERRSANYRYNQLRLKTGTDNPDDL